MQQKIESLTAEVTELRSSVTELRAALEVATTASSGKETARDGEPWTEVVRRGKRNVNNNPSARPETTTAGRSNTHTPAGMPNRPKQPKVVVVGKRKVWGTLRATSAIAVSNTIKAVAKVDGLKVKRKYTKGPRNKPSKWWFIVHGEESTLKQLTNGWSAVKYQINWSLEPVYTFAENPSSHQSTMAAPTTTDTCAGHVHDPPSLSTPQTETNEADRVLDKSLPPDSAPTLDSNTEGTALDNEKKKKNPRPYCLSTNNNCNMRVLYYNARSLLPKIDDLLLSVEALNPHIVCVVESWLSDEIDDNEINIPGFQLFRSNRNRHGGGVLMYVSSIFVVSVMSPPSPWSGNTYPLTKF